jgi:hypothetical protein
MEIQIKKFDGFIICVGFIWLNGTCMHDRFPLPLRKEVLEYVVGKKIYYYFTNGFSNIQKYKSQWMVGQMPLLQQKWELFEYEVIPLRLNNTASIFYRIILNAFKYFIQALRKPYKATYKPCITYYIQHFLRAHTM